ncbi:hypothetical protein [Paenibacillus xylanilyticus]|uniref:hypothetical protein n=1 Tax=Paenibacillus xylanilyticus TaxID=248903 RepID=UPI003AAD7C43
MEKFEKFEQFKARKGEASAKRRELEQKHAEATVELERVKQDYAHLVRRSVVEEKNLDAEIDASDKKVSEIQRTIRRLEAQMGVGATAYQGDISPDDVAEAWNKEYAPHCLETLFNPAIKELAAAADAYRLAFQKAIRVATDIEDERKDMLSELRDSKYTYTTARPDIKSTECEFMKAVITAQDLRDFESMRRRATI